MLKPSDKTKPKTVTSYLHRIAKEELPKEKMAIFFAIICMMVAALTTSLSAWIIEPAIEELFKKKNPEALFAIPLAIAAISLIRGLASYGQSIIMGGIGQRIVSNLQKRMFKALMVADYAYLCAKHSTNFVTSFVNDALHLRDATTKVIIALVKEVFTIIGCIAVMFYQDWVLSCIALFVFLPGIVAIKRIIKRTRKAAVNSFNETAKLSTLVSEGIKGIRQIRIYGREQQEVETANTTIDKRLKHLMASVKARAASSPITEALSGIGMASAIYYAGFSAQSGGMDIENLMSFIAAMMLAYQPARSIANIAPNLQDAGVAAERIYSLIDHTPFIAEKENAIILDKAEGHIELKNVYFSYDKEQGVLNNLSLDVRKGQCIAFVGRSGAGKSTIINLIPRFYDVDSGQILLDGHDIKDIKLSNLRKHIAYVSQEPFLFDGTIYDNIAYGNINATKDEVIEVAKRAAALDFINSLPQGFNTFVGEGGMRLSGGQRQRIVIARAIIKDAPVLLLDEATSALDTESERQVQAALHELMKGRTTIVIAHRLSTIIHADYIYVFDKGEIVECGTHKKLLEKNGYYANLCSNNKSNISKIELHSE